MSVHRPASAPLLPPLACADAPTPYRRTFLPWHTSTCTRVHVYDGTFSVRLHAHPLGLFNPPCGSSFCCFCSSWIIFRCSTKKIEPLSVCGSSVSFARGQPPIGTAGRQVPARAPGSRPSGLSADEKYLHGGASRPLARGAHTPRRRIYPGRMFASQQPLSDRRFGRRL